MSLGESRGDMCLNGVCQSNAMGDDERCGQTALEEGWG